MPKKNAYTSMEAVHMDSKNANKKSSNSSKTNQQSSKVRSGGGFFDRLFGTKLPDLIRISNLSNHTVKLSMGVRNKDGSATRTEFFRIQNFGNPVQDMLTVNKMWYFQIPNDMLKKRTSKGVVGLSVEFWNSTLKYVDRTQFMELDPEMFEYQIYENGINTLVAPKDKFSPPAFARIIQVDNSESIDSQESQESQETQPMDSKPAPVPRPPMIMSAPDIPDIPKSLPSMPVSISMAPMAPAAPAAPDASSLLPTFLVDFAKNSKVLKPFMPTTNNSNNSNSEVLADQLAQRRSKLEPTNESSFTSNTSAPPVKKLNIPRAPTASTEDFLSQLRNRNLGLPKQKSGGKYDGIYGFHGGYGNLSNTKPGSRAINPLFMIGGHASTNAVLPMRRGGRASKKVSESAEMVESKTKPKSKRSGGKSTAKGSTKKGSKKGCPICNKKRGGQGGKPRLGACGCSAGVIDDESY